MEASGELPKGTSHTWAAHTKDMKALPEHKESSAKAKDFAPLNPGGTAEKHPDMSVPKDEVAKGIPVEKEHTTSTQKARAIAVDHVVEIPDYYKRLEKLEAKAEAEGMKRADRLVSRFEAMPDQHAAELEAATNTANNSLLRQRVLSEIGAGVGGAFQALPGLGMLMPSYSELRNNARSALEAKAEAHAQALAELQARHADQTNQALEQLRARTLKTASYFLPRSDEELNNQQHGLRWGTIAGGLAGGVFNSGTLPTGSDIGWQDFLPTLAGAKAGTQAGVLAAGMHRAFTDPILTTESGGAVPVSEGHMPGQGWRPLVGTLAGGLAGGVTGHEVGSNWLMGMHDPTGAQFTGTAVGGAIGALGGAAAGGLADKANAQDILRARGIKVAFDSTQLSTQMTAAPRGDELHLPMGENPYVGDPKSSAEYENGFAYAQAIGHQKLNQCTEGDVVRWQGNENAWRDGFASACQKFGLARVGDLVASQPKAAGAVPSALEPAGHWARGILATGAGVGGGIALHSLYGDPGELYTLVPPALAAVAGGTILGDLGHSASQLHRVQPGTPITGTDDPRVRVRQGLAALGGMAVGGGLGLLGGHYGVPESWHDTSGGHVPELVGASVGGVGGAMAGSALENRLSGRDKHSRYTLPTTEAHMTSIAPMTTDNAKTAGVMTPLIGTLGGAAAGALIGPHVSQLGDFIGQHHQGAEMVPTMAPVTDPASLMLDRAEPTAPGPWAPGQAPKLEYPGSRYLDVPTETPTPAMQHGPLSPEETLHLQKLYGAGIGGGAGLLGGLAVNAMSPDEERRHQPMMRTAEAKVAHLNLLKDIDGDVEGSAVDVLNAKVAALGTTLGTLAGIGGGALAGHYLAPAMHWSAMPGENAALGTVAQHQLVDPAMTAVDPNAGGTDQTAAREALQKNIEQLQNQQYLQGLQAGAGGASDAQWRGVSDIGRVMGAGVGGVAGYQAGRGLDEAFGLEKRERPLVISPMARPGY